MIVVPIAFHLYRFLLSFERFVGIEGKKPSLNAVKAGVRSKRRRQILNGDRSRRGSVLKKKRKVGKAKSEPSPCQELFSATLADDQDEVTDDKLSSEFVTDEKKCSAADEDSKTDGQQLDEAEQHTTLVSYCFLCLN